MEKFGATEAFTQSDEITLIWKPRMNRNETALVPHPHKGRVAKLCSLMSSHCSVEFYKLIHQYHDGRYDGFDCRIYGGSEKTATDSLRFRFIDAACNAYQQVAQSIWSPKRLHGMSVQDIKTALREEVLINPFEAYGDDAMLGVWFYKEDITTTSSPMELWGKEAVMIQRTGRQRIVRSNGAEMMKRIKENALLES
jgi:tRNA(His) 5'-end guanylyltransferase